MNEQDPVSVLTRVYSEGEKLVKRQFKYILINVMMT